MIKGFKLDRQLKKKNISRQYKVRVTLMDLVKIFTDEAERICENKTIANLIALESLRDYINNHVSNVRIVL